MSLEVRPITQREAFAFIREHHRHHRPPVGAKFVLSCYWFDHLVGVSVVGRPVSRVFDDGWTAEVTRLCTDGWTPHVASKLYAASWRAARAMGYKRLITYTLASESGTSVKAAGWRIVYATKDRPMGWDTPSRSREVYGNTGAKLLWDVRA